MSADLRTIVDGTLADARRVLVGSAGVGTVVESLFWYGAVDIDPANLVVWVLLSGRPDDRLPVWYFPALAINEENTHLDADLLAWIEGTHHTLVDRFTLAGWPNPMNLRVGFDSAHRVRIGGGWGYFK